MLASDIIKAELMKYDPPTSNMPPQTGIIDFCFQPYINIPLPSVPQINEAIRVLVLSEDRKLLAASGMDILREGSGYHPGKIIADFHKHIPFNQIFG